MRDRIRTLKTRTFKSWEAFGRFTLISKRAAIGRPQLTFNHFHRSRSSLWARPERHKTEGQNSAFSGTIEDLPIAQLPSSPPEKPCLSQCHREEMRFLKDVHR